MELPPELPPALLLALAALLELPPALDAAALLELLELYFPKKRRRGKQAAQPEQGKRSAGMVVLFAFLYLLIAFSLGAMMWPMCEAFVPLGMSWLYFLMVFLMGVFVGIIGSVFST